MKCLIFLFTLCSIGTFIDMQGETDSESVPAQTDNDTRKTDNDVQGETDSESVPAQTDNDTRETDNDVQGKTDSESEPAQIEYDMRLELPVADYQPEKSGEEDDDPSAEDENNLAGETSISWEVEPSEHSEQEQVIISDENSPSSSDNEDTSKEIDKETMKMFMNEVAAGDTADLIGQNQHIKQSSMYHDLGRRSEPQALKNKVAENPDHLTPEKAPPELVLLVARESRLLGAGKDNELNDIDRKKILRSGNYWDGVWKEHVIPKSAMRSAPQVKQLGSIKAKINPGTEFYKVVSRMKKISPKLVYIINKK